MIPHIRVAASSDLKEFTGKDRYEDRDRSWVTKVKTAFIQHQAPDSEKCLVMEVYWWARHRIGTDK